MPFLSPFAFPPFTYILSSSRGLRVHILMRYFVLAIPTSAKRLPKVAKTQCPSAAVLLLLLSLLQRMNVAAVFTPNSKTDISTGWESCKMESVTGVCPKFTLAEPLTGQGFLRNEIIDSWDVSKVTSLQDSKSCFRLCITRLSLN